MGIAFVLAYAFPATNRHPRINALAISPATSADLQMRFDIEPWDNISYVAHLDRLLSGQSQQDAIDISQPRENEEEARFESRAEER